MLKFDWNTKSSYLVCDGCGYPFAEGLSAYEAEKVDTVIEDENCYEIEGNHLCLECVNERYRIPVVEEIKHEVIKKSVRFLENRKARLNDEQQGKVGEHNETDSR